MAELHSKRAKLPESYIIVDSQTRAKAAISSHPYFYKFGWILLFPIVLSTTILLKLKNRKLANDEKYIEHQIEYFSFFKGIQNRLGLDHLIGTDKFHKLRPIVVEYAFLRDGVEPLSVLDVATGFGFQAKALKEAGASDVYGIDIVPERIRGAKQLHEADGITFEVMDAANLRFPDDHFDCTTISAALHDMPHCTKRKVIAEMIRVTKPNGSIVILEPRTFKNRFIGLILGIAGELLDESLNIKDYVMEDLNPLLEEKGLEIVRDENHSLILNIKLCRVVK